METDRLNRFLTLGANVGVIAGIIFLGYELRQNNQLLVEEARLSMLENQKSWAYFVSAADNVSISVISPEESSDLSRADKIRRTELIGTMLLMWQWEFEQSQSDLLGRTPLAIGAYRYGWKAYRVADIWPELRDWYSDEFVQFVELNVTSN